MDFKEITKVTFNLAAVYTVGCVLLAGVYAVTSPVIFKNKKEDKENALKAMVPGAINAPAKLGDWSPYHKHAEYYAVEGPEGKGFIVETFGKGYSSYINILVALDKDYVVKKINILSHGETPGLGDEILMPWFKDQYIGKDLDHLVVIKGETPDKIQAITGATISTRAVTNGLRDAITMINGVTASSAAGTSSSGGAAPPSHGEAQK